MAALTGIIILTAALKPLITTPFRPASLLPLYTEAFTASAAAKGKAPSTSTRATGGQNGNDDCVLWVGEGLGSLCWISRGGLYFLCGVGKEANPLLAFRFLEVFVDVLTEYLGEITETQIKDNFDVVYQLLEEMLDEGYPLTTESNLLRDIVLPPTLLSKVLSAAGVSGLGGPALGQPFSSPIPWRRPGVKHSSAEIFFDFAETLALTLDRKGGVVRDDRWGVLECNARLSGVPEISLHLGGGAVKGQGLHPCVRLGRYEKDGTLSFIPPDGRFRLMDYVIPSPTAAAATSAGVSGSSALSSNRVGGIDEQSGVRFKTRIKLHESGGTFEISISSTQPSRPLENAVLRWNLGEGVVPAKTTVFGASADDGSRWEIEGGQTLVWRLGLLPPRSLARTLSGAFTTTSPPLPATELGLTYTVHQHSLSGLRVGKLTCPGMGDGAGPSSNSAANGGGGGGGGGPKVFRGMRSRVECTVYRRW